MADVTGISITTEGQAVEKTGNNVVILGTVTLNKAGFPDEGIPGGQEVGFTLIRTSDNAPFGSEQKLTGNGQVIWTNIPWDTYYIRETTTPAGYAPINDIESIVISSAQQSYIFSAANDKIFGSVELTKNFVGLETTASFRLRGEDGYYYFTTGGAKADPLLATYQISHKGDKITWLSLPWQEYTVEETAITGYNSVIDVSTFTIGLAASDNGPTAHLFQAVIATNTQLPGEIHLHKFDAVDPSIDLSNATFELFLMVNGVPTSPVKDMSGNAINPVITDADGLAEFMNLEWGTYLVKETIPPTGYLPLEETVTISGTSRIINLEIAEPRDSGKIGINKVGPNGITPLTGAGFTLYNSAGTVILRAEKLVDAAGKAAFSNLDWGKYLIVETTVPPGYSKAPDRLVTIDAQNAGRVLNVTIVNTPTGGGGGTVSVAGITEGSLQVLAFTGIDPVIPISGVSVLIAGITIVAASLRRKRRIKNK